MEPELAPEFVEEELLSSQMNRWVGPYELVHTIGRGGMAQVFEARYHAESGKTTTVALKLIRPDLESDPSILSMFLDEASLGARLTHPNLCPVYDVGEVDGTYYIAMELLAGRSLLEIRRRLRSFRGWFESPRSVEVACAAIADAAEGLHAIHEARDDQGLPLFAVHRDVSPQNLFLTVHGPVRVLDLGVARFRTRSHTTQAGTTKGKYLYMAPEQLYSSDVDRRADVWALAACMRELLLGETMFGDSTERVNAEQERTPLAPVGTLRPGIPPELDAALGRALAYQPSERTPTARQFGAEVGRFVSGDRKRVLREFLQWLEEAEAPADSLDDARTLAFRGAAEPEAGLELADADSSEAVDEEDERTTAWVPGDRSRGAGASGAGAAASVAPSPVPASSAPVDHHSRIEDKKGSPESASGMLPWVLLAVGLLLVSTLATSLLLLLSSTPSVVHQGAEEGASGPMPEPRATRGRNPSLKASSRPVQGDLMARAAGTRPGASSLAPGREPRGTEQRSRPGIGARSGAPSSRPVSPPAPEKTGTLRVRSTQPRAQVFVDGRSLGTTPFEQRLSVGRHRLRVQSESGAEQALTVDIDRGAIHQITIPF